MIYNQLISYIAPAAPATSPKKSKVSYQFFTISNCLVNLISPEQYRDFVLPFDMKISTAFDLTGIHNCAWNANP